MSSPDNTLLCRYHYDPLDRLADCTPSAQARTQRFYLKDRLTSEIQGSVRRSIFQQEAQLLAQQEHQDDAVETTLLATDQQRSVLHALDATQSHPLAYTPYGHRPAQNGLLSLLGFNGERPDPVTGHYLLGNGYRAFNPVLMRFNSPDSLSPFGEGGLNAYVYCVGDPVNRNDPTGHTWVWLKRLLRTAGVMSPASSPPSVVRTAVNINNPTPSISNTVPPPPYSPPSTRHADIMPRIHQGPASEITRLESIVSIDRGALNDIHNGRLLTSSEVHAQVVHRLNANEQRISELKGMIPPPNYEEALNAPRPDDLPSYTAAIRDGI
ncbi:RHS repeat-associated core domain-containing protein [Pseudomonas sp. T1.Ur]|uniref:RHS repeat-associated core domain-containing protein n=1 Tax=Pseudomonas sp. T1.Ur TaxID=2928704 RepID=UPI00201D8B78|nr:RHS repeat-associated core domain-containing protein [Pseudomonas sp. T1.Ur]MCL6705192.1 RHS repeat-associated core domain-containing protein [Pseudomonas sp. T1.Ur]